MEKEVSVEILDTAPGQRFSIPTELGTVTGTITETGLVFDPNQSVGRIDATTGAINADTTLTITAELKPTIYPKSKKPYLNSYIAQRLRRR